MAGSGSDRTNELTGVPRLISLASDVIDRLQRVLSAIGGAEEGRDDMAGLRDAIDIAIDGLFKARYCAVLTWMTADIESGQEEAVLTIGSAYKTVLEAFLPRVVRELDRTIGDGAAVKGQLMEIVANRGAWIEGLTRDIESINAIPYDSEDPFSLVDSIYFNVLVVLYVGSRPFTLTYRDAFIGEIKESIDKLVNDESPSLSLGTEEILDAARSAIGAAQLLMLLFFAIEPALAYARTPFQQWNREVVAIADTAGGITRASEARSSRFPDIERIRGWSLRALVLALQQWRHALMTDSQSQLASALSLGLAGENVEDAARWSAEFERLLLASATRREKSKGAGEVPRSTMPVVGGSRGGGTLGSEGSSGWWSRSARNDEPTQTEAPPVEIGGNIGTKDAGEKTSTEGSGIAVPPIAVERGERQETEEASIGNDADEGEWDQSLDVVVEDDGVTNVNQEYQEALPLRNCTINVIIKRDEEPGFLSPPIKKRGNRAREAADRTGDIDFIGGGRRGRRRAEDVPAFD